MQNQKSSNLLSVLNGCANSGKLLHLSEPSFAIIEMESTALSSAVVRTPRDKDTALKADLAELVLDKWALLLAGTG